MQLGSSNQKNGSGKRKHNSMQSKQMHDKPTSLIITKGARLPGKKQALKIDNLEDKIENDS